MREENSYELFVNLQVAPDSCNMAQVRDARQARALTLIEGTVVPD